MDYKSRFPWQRDPFWFIERLISVVTENGFFFGVIYFVLVCLIIEVSCETYLLKYKPSMETVLRLGPMYSNFVYCICCIIPCIKQKYQYRKLIISIRNDFFSLVNIDADFYEEIRELYRAVVMVTLFLFGMAFLADTALIPWFGVDYKTTIWAEEQFLSIIVDPPRWLTITLIFINYATVYPKSYFMCIYGVHLMHLCLLYKMQHMLLRRKLKNIRYRGKIEDLYLNDLASYQRWVRLELIECVKLHIRLKQFGTSVANYFNLTVLIHTFTAVLMFTMIGYIILFTTQPMHNLIAFEVELGVGTGVVFTYVHFAEIFAAQISEVRNTVYELPWNTFNSKNREIMMIYSHILNKTQGIGIMAFTLNYGLAVWILHKVFNFLMILRQLEEKL